MFFTKEGWGEGGRCVVQIVHCNRISVTCVKTKKKKISVPITNYNKGGCFFSLGYSGVSYLVFSLIY